MCQINFEPSRASGRLEKRAKTYGQPCTILISALTGAYVLATYGGNYYSDAAITYFMPLAIGYFLYDFFAMIEVYIARLNETEGSSQSDKTIRGFVKNQPLISIHHLALSLFFIPLMVSQF